MARSSQPAASPAALAWESFLQDRLGSPAHVSFGCSRTLPIQIRRTGRGTSAAEFQLRLHTLFQAAPREIQEAVAGWILRGRAARAACAELDRWLGAELERLPKPSRRPLPLHPKGRAFDLERLADPLWASYFAADFLAGRGRPGLSWGRTSLRKSQNSLRLGSYSLDSHRVQIHPVLDQQAVPTWFVSFVLFHEVLHAALPPTRAEGRRWVHHGPEFRRRERAHPDYVRALAWERRHLVELLRAARTGKPLGT